MSEYTDALRQQILDGKRSWDYRDYDNDPDRFLTEVAGPLNDLVRSGAIEDIAETKMNRRGASFIARVDILGAINLEKT
jgi:hypothetical protein